MALAVSYVVRKVFFGSFSTIRTRAELVWYKPTIRSAERTQTLRRRTKQRLSRALDDPPPLLRGRAADLNLIKHRKLELSTLEI
jgi:hypothetical protein